MTERTGRALRPILAWLAGTLVALAALFVAALLDREPPLGPAITAAAPGVLVVTDETSILPAVAPIAVFRDLSRDMTIDQVAAPENAPNFRKPAKASGTIGHSRAVWWARLTVEDARSRPGPLFLVFRDSLVGHIQLYTPIAATGRYSLQEDGFELGPDNGAKATRHVVFTLATEPLARTTVYLRIASQNGIALPVDVVTAAHFDRQEKREQMMLGVLLGIMAAMAFYMLLVWISLRERSLLLLSMLFLSLMTLIMFVSGFRREFLWVGTPELNLICNRLAILGVMVFGVLFPLEALQVRRHSPRFMPVAQALIAAVIVNTLSAIFLRHWASFVLSWLILATVTLCGVIAVVSIRRRIEGAGLYMLGWSMLLLGAAAKAASDLGIAAFADLPVNMLYLGAGISSIILAVNLSLLIRRRQRQHAREQAESLQRYDLAARATEDGLFDVDRNTHRLYTSARIREIMDVESTNFDSLFEDWRKRTHPDDRDWAAPIMRDLIAGRRTHAAIEHRIIRRNGTVTWIAARLIAVQDKDGAVARIVGSVTDISARKKAEAARRENETLVRSIIDTAVDAIVTFDADYRILEFNPAAERVFGRDHDSLFGQRFDQIFVAPGHFDAFRLRIAPLANAAEGSRDHCDFEIDAIHADGHVFPIEIRASAMKVAGHRVVAAFIRDVAEIRQARNDLVRANQTLEQRVAERTAELEREIAERRAQGEELRATRDEAEAAMRAKSEFLAVMSHEIRTPMNGVLGMARLLQRSKLDETQADQVRTILQSGTALLAILNRILDFSKLEAGKVEIDIVEFDLVLLVSDCVALMTPKAAEKGLRLVHDIRGDVPNFALGDASRIRQVLLNLIGNAIKFTEKGGVNIHIQSARLDDGDVLVRFAVRDTGIGVSDDVRSKLFNQFSQADSTISRRYGGTGLGLAISRRIVEVLGGRMGVESMSGAGSTFWFEVPLVPIGHLTAGDGPKPGALPPLRVLLAEDNPTNQKVAAGLLRQDGHFVDVADDGAAAVAAVDAGAYDVVLMDMQMPGMDGLEATRRIRARGDEKGAIPIIAMTANTFPEDIQRCRDAGMDAHIGKPFDPDQLTDAIRQILLEKGRDLKEMKQQAEFDRAQLSLLPPVPEQAEQTLIDDGKLAKLEQRLGRADVADLVIEFLNLQSEAMMVATGKRDAPIDLAAVRLTAHTIKGTGGSFGMIHLASTAAAIELACKTGDESNLEILLKRLNAAIEDTRHAVATRYAQA